jgi:hypothetical protein
MMRKEMPAWLTAAGALLLLGLQAQPAGAATCFCSFVAAPGNPASIQSPSSGQGREVLKVTAEGYVQGLHKGKCASYCQGQWGGRDKVALAKVHPDECGQVGLVVFAAIGTAAYERVNSASISVSPPTCLHGGTDSGPNCSIAAGFENPGVIPGIDYWVDTNPQWPGVYYQQIGGQCPYGGEPSGPNCQLRSFPPGFVKPGVAYWVATDVRWPGVYYQQAAPGQCPYGGSPGGPNCHLTSFKLPAYYLVKGVSYSVDANPQWPGVYYGQVQGECIYGGSKAGPNCQVRALPPNVVKPGVKYWVDADPRWPGIYYAKACK